jgi:hypothetical protein
MEFLKIFECSPADSQSVVQFINSATVIVNTKTHSLKDYMKHKKLDKPVIEQLYTNIKNRNAYLTRFYNTSLLVNDKNTTIHSNMEPMKKEHMDNNKAVLYKNVIRNMHLYDILQKTKSGFHNNPSYLDIVIDLYTKNIINYKILTPSAVYYMENGRLGSVFSSFYFRASIMNPYLVYSLNKRILKGTKIFTPTLGWSSYLVGFLECPEVVEYVGTDVIPDVCKKTKYYAKKYNAEVNILCKPSEKLYHSKTFINKYREHFDVVFFSPPYYKLELYDSADQSTNTYDTYNEWLHKYWEKTIMLSQLLLEKGGKICYIISDYGSGNVKPKYDLVNDMNEITSKYFHFVSNQSMYNKNVHATSHRETSERIIIFEKS